MSAESCGICFDDYKGKKVVKVTCQYCPSHACRACQQRYLLQSYEDPHCMECKRGWAPEFMAANFPLIFRNDALRKHRRKILFEREKAVLPAMQVYVGYKQDEERLEKEMAEFTKVYGKGYSHKDTDGTTNLSGRYILEKAKYDRAYADRSVANSKYRQWKTGRDYRDQPVSEEEIAAAKTERNRLRKIVEEIEPGFLALQKEFREKMEELTALNQLFWRAKAQYEDRWVVGGAAAPREPKREFIMKCPDGDCRGFLSTAYKCGTCAKFTCTQCHVVLGAEKSDDHICNKDDVESAKAIKSETRPCPKCGTRIFKIDGCDQMWCVMEGCGTAFSWNTGHVVTGVVHNPHYYEWLRRTGGGQAPREVGDIPCGGLPGYGQLYHVLNNAGLRGYGGGGAEFTLFQNFTEVHRNISELINMRLREFPARPAAMANKDHDVAYLMKKTDEAEWRRQLEFTEAKFKRKKEIGQILQMAATAGSDAMNRVLIEMNRLGRNNAAVAQIWLRETAMPELEQLREFVNQSLRDLAKREHMAVPQLGENWKWMPLRALYRAPGKGKKKVVAGGVEAGGTANEIVEDAAGAGLIGPAEDEVIEILED